MKQRMGADFILISKGAEKNNEGILLAGTLTNFYMDKAIEDTLKNVKDIEMISSQVYVATIAASCSSFPIQAIGIDLATDFIIKPWVLDDLKN